MYAAGHVCCSEACHRAHAHMEGLVRQTLHEGCIKEACLPERTAITVSAGHDDKAANSQTSISIPAARQLLQQFSGGVRHVTNEEGRVQSVQLTDAFLDRTHPLRQFNNAYTLTLWTGCSENTHSLEVSCVMWRHASA